MGPTGRRLAVLTATLFLLSTGTALADPAPAPAQGPITLSPEQATWVCTERIPGILARIDKARTRIGGDAATRGSTAWLQARHDEAQAAGKADDAARLQERIDARPARLDRLADVQKRLTAFRDTNCVS